MALRMSESLALARSLGKPGFRQLLAPADAERFARDAYGFFVHLDELGKARLAAAVELRPSSPAIRRELSNILGQVNCCSP
jgi:hypothetical protein